MALFEVEVNFGGCMTCANVDDRTQLLEGCEEEMAVTLNTVKNVAKAMGDMNVRKENDILSLLSLGQAEAESSGVPMAIDPVSAREAVHSRRNFNTANELLDRATRAFDLLINRCQYLENELEKATVRAREQAAEQAEIIDHLKQLNLDAKRRAETAEETNLGLKSKAEAAESRAAKAEERVIRLREAAAQATEQAELADELSTKLHDKVVTAFGIGSRAHPVLQVLTTDAE